MTGTAENCAKPRQRASRPRGSEAAVRCRQQGRARPGGGSVASEMRKPRPLPAAAGQFSRARSSQRVMSARPKNARPVAQGGAAAPDKYGLAQLLRLRPPATLKGPALTWSERAGPNSGAIRNAAPLGCLNARDERMVDGVGAAGSRRRLRELKNAALTRSRRRAMLGQGAGRLRPSAPAPGPHPPRHQAASAPTSTRNNAGSARSRSRPRASMSRCGDPGRGRGGHAMPTSSRFRHTANAQVRASEGSGF